MRSWIGSALVVCAALAYTAYCLAGGHGCCPNCGAPSECCYQPTTVYRCKQVPDNKPIKKIVYEMKEVPYCTHKLPHCHDCDCCLECKACPKFKRQLVKKEITCGETCGTKCVVEEFCEMLPVPCCKCGHRGHCK